MKPNKFISLLLILAMCLQLMPVTAWAADETAGAETSPQYLQGLTLPRSNNDPEPLYLLGTSLPYEQFQFDPEQTEYNIMLTDPTVEGRTICTATLTQEYADSLSVADAANKVAIKLLTSSGTCATGTAQYFKENTQKVPLQPLKLNISKTFSLTSSTPYTATLVVGMAPSGVVLSNATFSDSVSYTFNFYCKATLKSLTAIEGDNTEVKVSDFNAYSTNITLENVNANAETLTISATPLTAADNTKVKFDNGQGEYVEGNVLTLANYADAKYQQEDGSLVIPFMLDYAGNDNDNTVAGVDGYYTLTVTFGAAEVDYTPTFSAITPDQTVTVNTPVTLTAEVAALESDAANPVTYKWYSSDNAAGETKQEIAGAAQASYTPPTNAAGTVYYFCEATRTVEDKTYTALSSAVKVTVNSAVTPAGRYVKNISVKTLPDEYMVLDNFDPQTTSYNIRLPYLMTTLSDDKTVMPIEFSEAAAANKDNLRFKYWLENADGTKVRENGKEYRVASYIDKNFDLLGYNLYDWADNGGGLSTAQTIFKPVMPGNYVLKLNVYELGKEAEGEKYSFNVAYFPRFDKFTVSASGKMLAVQPAVSSGVNANTFAEDFYVTALAGTNKLTLNGRLMPYTNDVQFMYDGQDKTADFEQKTGEGGVQVDLSRCQPGENGAITVPFALKYGDFTQNCRLHINFSTAADWQITTQPAGGTYDKGEDAVLTVATNAAEGAVDYQWQSCNYETTNLAAFADVENATSASFSAPTNNGGAYATRWYCCKITDKATGIFAYSDIVKVEVDLGQVNAPEIIYQPGLYVFSGMQPTDEAYKTVYKYGEKPEPMQALVNMPEGDASINRDAPTKIEMQWYHNTERSTVGAEPLPESDFSGGANSASRRLWSCVPSNKLAVGKHYFYFVATAVSVDDAENRTSVTSDFVEITVNERGELAGFTGQGTEADPYMIHELKDLQKIDEYVMSGDSLAGAVFKFAEDADITLPVDWEPIGKSNGGNGKYLLPFSGTIDGSGKTLKVAEGGRPLLEFARDAVVHDLNIYGTKINGAGLLEKGSIDYGTDGVYQELTDPDVITLENVNLLSGSQTKTSGLVYGGSTSGINDVIIKNCTIEPGVIVGYDKNEDRIGSFVGTLNGRIENSVSYAEVYGVNCVGGLAGVKGQSMGDCEIVNSAFLGKVEATGLRVGGILGSGYVSGSAPSTPPVTVRNCYAAANITANSAPTPTYSEGGGIGGILGSEIGATALRNNGAIRDNHFCGTITDTNPDDATRYKRVGGILGEAGNYDTNKLVYANNYYLANDNYTGLGYQRIVNKDWQPDKDSFIPKQAAEFGNGDVTALLNQGEFKNWVQSTEAGKEYPVHSAEPVLYRLEVSGEYNDTFYIGDKLDLTGMVLTGVYTDGSSKVIALDDPALQITGYDPNKQAFQTVDLVYGAAKTSVTVKVLKKPSGDSSKDSFTVYFTLLGDSEHGEATAATHTLKAGNLQVWLPREAYTLKLNATVWDLMQEVQKKHKNVAFSNPTGNYVDKITFDGLTIGEFTNGNLSGWMFTLNDKHPLLGVSEQFLDEGNEIVFHYTDDYTVEEGSENWDTPSGGGGGTTATEKPAVTTEMKPEVTANTNGEAIAKPADKAVNETIAQAKQDKADTIVIEPNVKGDATKIGVELAKTAVEKMTEDTNADLTVKTDLGSVTVPAKGLEQLTQEKGNNVTVTVEAKDGATNIVVAVGGKAVEQVNGGIGVTVPAEKASEGDVLAIVKADGTQEIVKKSVVEGKNVQAIIDGSCTVKVIENGKTFADTNNHWGKDAVAFVTAHELFNGTSDKAFEPNAAMSRAMLATVLWRLEDEQSAAAAKTFSDIAGGQYYTEAVAWASDKQIVTGYEDGSFKPNNNINREELAAMLYRYAKAVGLDANATGDLTKFADGAKVSAFAADAMKWAVGSGLMNGKENNTLDPQGSATRAEVATTMQRLVKLLVQ